MTSPRGPSAYAFFWRMPDRVTDPMPLRDAAPDHLARYPHVARERGAMLAFETVPSATLVAAVERVGSPALGVRLDPANTARIEEERMAGAIEHIRTHDPRPSHGPDAASARTIVEPWSTIAISATAGSRSRRSPTATG